MAATELRRLLQAVASVEATATRQQQKSPKKADSLLHALSSAQLQVLSSSSVCSNSSPEEEQEIASWTLNLGHLPLTSPLRNSETMMSVAIVGMPIEGIRSRSENLIRLVLRWQPISNTVGTEFFLRLPLLQMPPYTVDANERDSLMISADVVPARCATVEEALAVAPLRACDACVHRERRKAARRPGAVNASGEGDSPPVSQVGVSEAERARIIVFNGQTTLVQIDTAGTDSREASLAFRITCYCRHHAECCMPTSSTTEEEPNPDTGFKVLIRLVDQRKAVVGVALTAPIIITDDHKRKRAASAIAAASKRGLHSPPAFALTRELEMPSIFKTVPAEGPIQGGIEVTVIGNNLQNTGRVFFGSVEAMITMRVSPHTLVVKLPPASIVGPVVIGLVQSAADKDEHGNDVPPIVMQMSVFVYKNDLDRSMMELALQLVGLKMLGRVEDAREVAMKIIASETDTHDNGKISLRTHAIA